MLSGIIRYRYIKAILDSIKAIIFILLVYLLVSNTIQPAFVVGDSMNPTLDDGDFIAINTLAYKKDIPNRGDIVVFQSNIDGNGEYVGKSLIKRVIGVEGDKVEVVNGFVYLNGTKLNEPYLDGVFTDGNINVIVPKNSVFVLGDNRPNSLDSRSDTLGVVDLSDILGEVFIRLYPLNKLGKLS